jgi:hypothetical protein
VPQLAAGTRCCLLLLLPTVPTAHREPALRHCGQQIGLPPPPRHFGLQLEA